MRRSTTLVGASIGALVLVMIGASIIFAAHENGVASNGGCDEFYWQAREPGENMAGEVSDVTASTTAAQVVVAQQIDIPCDGTQQITFNASAAANAGTYLSTYVRITCQSGRCLEVGNPPGMAPTAARPFVQQQICAPGDNLEPGNNRGTVILSNPTTFNDLRAGVSQTTFCGSTPPGGGQIASGVYLVEVFAYQTNATGQAAGGGARLDERALSIELWAQADCYDNGRERNDRDCGRRGRGNGR